MVGTLHDPTFTFTSSRFKVFNTNVLLRKYSGEVNETKSCARQSHGDKDKMCDSKQKENI